jgi:hypothetical protein
MGEARGGKGVLSAFQCCDDDLITPTDGRTARCEARGPGDPVRVRHVIQLPGLNSSRHTRSTRVGVVDCGGGCVVVCVCVCVCVCVVPLLLLHLAHFPSCPLGRSPLRSWSSDSAHVCSIFKF